MCTVVDKPIENCWNRFNADCNGEGREGRVGDKTELVNKIDHVNSVQDFSILKFPQSQL